MLGFWGQGHLLYMGQVEQIAAGEGFQHFSRCHAEGAVPRRVLRERRSRKCVALERPPPFALHPCSAETSAGPGVDAEAGKQPADRGDWTSVIIEALRLPGCDRGIVNRVCQREEEPNPSYSPGARSGVGERSLTI